MEHVQELQKAETERCLFDQAKHSARPVLPAGNGSLQSMMELLHNFLARPRWEESAMQRAKQMFLSHYKSLHKSLERETADRIMGAMFGPSR